MNLQMYRRLIFRSFNNPSFFAASQFSCPFPLYLTTSSEKESKTSVPVSDSLLHKHQFFPETVSQVASVLTGIKNPEKCGSILSFFKEIGVSANQLERMVKNDPRLLSRSLEKTIKPKIKIFQDLGFLADDIANIISSESSILHRNVLPSLTLLIDLLGSCEEVAKVLKVCGWYLRYDLERVMLPNIKFIKSCGVGMEQIRRHIYTSSGIFLRKPADIKKIAKQVDEMGVCRSSKMFVHAVRVITSMSSENWELKLNHFRDLGFSEDEILQMFRKFPPVFSVSQGKLKQVKEVLLATGNYNISSIVRDPGFCTYSLEKKIKPRMQVLGILGERDLLPYWPSLSTVIRMEERRFLERFVHPHMDEVGEIYTANSALNCKINTENAI